MAFNKNLCAISFQLILEISKDFQNVDV